MIYKHFDRQFPEGLLDSWSPIHSTDSNLDRLDMSNCYLTPLRDVSGLVESVPFHKGVDPRNILRDMAKDNHIHTEDNYVEYFSSHRDSNGQRRSVKKDSNVNEEKLTASANLDTQIPGLRTPDVPSGRYCSSSTFFCCYSGKSRTSEDAYDLEIAGAPG